MPRAVIGFQIDPRKSLHYYMLSGLHLCCEALHYLGSQPRSQPDTMIKLFKSLFGGGGDSASPKEPAADAIEYKQFSIRPEPIKEGSQYRTAGTISLQQDGEAKSSKFIRADNHSTRDAAIEHAIGKGKQIIDERGEALLQTEHC